MYSVNIIVRITQKTRHYKMDFAKYEKYKKGKDITIYKSNQ